MHFRKFGSVLLVSAAVVGGSALMVPAASAGTGDCPAGRLCLWEDYNFVTNGHGKEYFPVVTYVAHLGSQVYKGTGDIVGDSSSSYFNSSSAATYRLYKNANCVGPHFDAKPLHSDSNFGNGSPKFSDGSKVNDEVSSVVKLGDSSALEKCHRA